MSHARLDKVLQHLRIVRDSQNLADAADAELLDRFTFCRDEPAFTALLRRHGPMVFGVAQRVLHAAPDAEDVFQATFLLLVRKARSIRKRASVASWLHGVAHRLALRAKQQRSCRRGHEQRAADMRRAKPEPESVCQDLQAALDTALDDLPERYRGALIACYLEGMSHAEAAQHLGCPLATLRTRLARGRNLLRLRLTKHGRALTSAGLVALLLANAAEAAPAALAKATARAALAVASGQTLAAVCSAPVARLVDGGLKTMFLGKVRIGLAFLLAATVASVAGGLALSSAWDEETGRAAKPKEALAGQQPRGADKDADIRTYRGRVVDTAGKPIAGAKLYVPSRWQTKKVLPAAKLQATCGADGRFEFRAKPHEQNMLGLLVATADGYGPNWAPGDPKEDLTVTLPEDDVPINGRIVDLQGKPVVDATIRVLHVQTSNNSPKYDDLTGFLRAARAQKDGSRQPEYQFFITFVRSEEIPTLPQLTRTDADGRFSLRGVGRERMVGVAIEGPTIATQEVRILTRKPKAGAEQRAAAELSGMIYYCATFTHAAAPTQPITGTVRAKDTRKPIAGVQISSQSPRYSYVGRSLVSTTTDAEGRYRLVGAPKGGKNHVVASAGDAPFLTAMQRVPAGQGFEAVTVDFELKRGVWVQGHVVDKVTRKPVSHVRVGYAAFEENPHLKDAPPLYNLAPGDESAEDGAYRVLALPGPGIIGLRANDWATAYLSEPERDGGERRGFLNTRPNFEHPGNYNLMTRIDPKAGTESLQLDLALDPGETRKGTVRDSAGEPLGGTQGYRLGPWSGWEPQRDNSGEFTLRAFNPRRPRSVIFQHEARKLVGILDVPADANTPLTVRLQRACSVSGQLVDADGQPRANVELEVSFLPSKREAWTHHLPNRISTDPQGRFQVGGLIPNVEYTLSDRQGEIPIAKLARPGESKDLGNVQAKKPQ